MNYVFLLVFFNVFLMFDREGKRMSSDGLYGDLYVFTFSYIALRNILLFISIGYCLCRVGGDVTNASSIFSSKFLFLSFFLFFVLSISLCVCVVFDS